MKNPFRFLSKNILLFSWFAFLVSFLPAPTLQAKNKHAGDQPELVGFPSGGKTLHGFLYMPAVSETSTSNPKIFSVKPASSASATNPQFPAIVWTHGAGEQPGKQQALGDFFSSHGIVFFVVHRRGDGQSSDAGKDLEEKMKNWNQEHPNASEEESGKHFVKLMEDYNQDVIDATHWLMTQNFVDKQRVLMMGHSQGAQQALISADKGLGLRGYIAFSPGAIMWKTKGSDTPMSETIKDAIGRSEAPIFMAQATGDYSMGPTETFGPLVNAKGAPSQSKVYPQFGNTPKENHAKFALTQAGIDIWGDDVLAFIHKVLATNKNVNFRTPLYKTSTPPAPMNKKML